MKLAHKAYRFRLYPNQQQQQMMAKTFGCVRLVYNHYLDKKTKTYEETGKSISYTQCAADLVDFKKEKPFLKEVDSISLQQALRHLDTAFAAFFRDKKIGYPRFKSRKNHRASYSTVCVNHNIRLEGKGLLLPKLGVVRIRKHREIPEEHQLKSVTVIREATGKYYASILYEYRCDENQVDILQAKAEDFLGIDYAMEGMAVFSDGRKSHELVDRYLCIAVEDIDMKVMSQCFHLGKGIIDNGYGMFRDQLDYKLKSRGKYLIRVDRYFPSSKTCSCCGKVKDILPLSEQIYRCECGNEMDRDVNAAINIREEGKRMLYDRSAHTCA